MLKLREAQADDCDLIVQYIFELAEFEKLSHDCAANADYVRKWLFGETPRAGCILAEWDGQPAGFAVYFYNFSTFLTQPGIYIEDIFIRPDFRRRKIARNMFRYFARKGLAENCGRLEWWVLDWNEDAIGFYQSMGAVPMNEWTVQRISGDALSDLAKDTG
jgi:GNAT superfamily N-acetyltransferase